MNTDPELIKLVRKQTDLFNQDAPEIERMVVSRQIQDYQNEHKERA